MISRRWFMGLLGGAAATPIAASVAARPQTVSEMREAIKAHFPEEFAAMSRGLPITQFRGVNADLGHWREFLAAQRKRRAVLEEEDRELQAWWLEGEE